MAILGTFTHREMEIFIEKNYGHAVSWDGKQKNLVKFGSNSDVGTSFEDVWRTGGVESLPTVAQGNVITHIASSNAGDTGITIVVEGHTQDALGKLTFVVQTVTLAGQTKTALPTPIARCTRAYNSSAIDLLGNVYVARDVTFTAGVPASDIHITIVAGLNQSQKASTSISDSDFWVITEIRSSVRRTQTRFVDFYLQVREYNGVWRTRRTPISVSNSSGTIHMEEHYPLIIPPNSDVRVQAISSGVTTEVGSALAGALFIKQSAIYD